MLTWPLPESSNIRSISRRISGRGWWIVMMTVTPADARADRMSTTLDALLLSSPEPHNRTEHQKEKIESEINFQKNENIGITEKATAQELKKARQHIVEKNEIQQNQTEENSTALRPEQNRW